MCVVCVCVSVSHQLIYSETQSQTLEAEFHILFATHPSLLFKSQTDKLDVSMKNTAA